MCALESDWSETHACMHVCALYPHKLDDRPARLTKRTARSTRNTQRRSLEETREELIAQSTALSSHTGHREVLYITLEETREDRGRSSRKTEG